jgi:hypothetical protein
MIISTLRWVMSAPPPLSPSAPKPSRRFAYRPPDAARTTFLFDLDETFVHSQPLRTATVEMPTRAQNYRFGYEGPRAMPQRFPPHSTVSVFTSAANNSVRLIHYRPYVIPFLRFCFEHFNVGFWSTGGNVYVRHITLQLLRMTGHQPADLVCAWARKSFDPSDAVSDATPPPHKFVDVLTGVSVRPPVRAMRSQRHHKDLQTVFARFPTLDRSRVVLVDNLPMHLVRNAPTNVLWIPPYTYLNTHDTVLHALGLRLVALRTQRCGGATTAEVCPSVRRRSSSSSSSAPNKRPPVTNRPAFHVDANDLRDIATVSPTHSHELHASGSVRQAHARAYTRKWRRGDKVIAPYQGLYVRATVQKVPRNQDTVELRKAGTRKQARPTFHVSAREVVGARDAAAYE